MDKRNKYEGIENARTERIYLEHLSVEEHSEDFHEIWSQEEGVRWTTKITMKSLEESREFMRTILPGEGNPDIDKFAILLNPHVDLGSGGDGGGLEVFNEKGKPKCIGIVGTNRWSEQGLETGYCLNARYWGRGLATEAFGLFLDYYWGLEDRKGINSLVAKTNLENKASERVLVKCGGRQGEVVSFVSPWREGEVVELRCWFFGRPEEIAGDGKERGGK